MKKLLLLAMAVAMVGCAGLGDPSRHKSTPAKALQGKWKPVDSVARYEILTKDKRLTIKAHSSLSGKKMEISNVSWDGKLLKFTSYMRHTNHKVHHINRLIDSETMESTTSGDNQRTVKWKKY
jgi:hypothetical protein